MKISMNKYSLKFNRKDLEQKYINSQYTNLREHFIFVNILLIIFTASLQIYTYVYSNWHIILQMNYTIAVLFILISSALIVYLKWDFE